MEEKIKMFENRFQKPVKPQSDGCQIKVSRDKSGRVKSVSTNGKCSKAELDIFRENMNSIEEQEEE